LKFENINDTINYNFKVVWDNPPLSLKNINYAIELMYYIITDTTYEHLLGLKRDQQWNEFFEIWRKFDTDTSTLFNEAMDEYYRRVDFAFLNFQTITEADGAKTDRGKIFILFGKPSYTQRIIDKDGNVLEYWFYYSLKKKFTFATKYKKFELVEIKDL
ncbi:MAG: GWxTD domain-containing protein, partial [Candidatus Kapaibacteriota bacterium]